MLFLLCVSAAFGAQGHKQTKTHSSRTAALRYLEGELQQYEHATWRWQRLVGVRPTQTAGRRLTTMAVTDLEQTVKTWHRRAVAARKRAQHPPHLAQWLCIHRYEAAWNDVGDPYWGGLQMSVTFQERYGGWLYREKGTADHWTPLEQMWVAEKALQVRGFWPWPNTARFCGLLE
jgi:hypothetical protein